MKTKIQKKYIDTGFGFPVHLLNVPMVKVRDEWVPTINWVAISDLVLQIMIEKKSKLTGDELRFIRTKFDMTLARFGERFYVTHAAVSKWEKHGENPTGMGWATEKDIRLFASIRCEGVDLSTTYERLRKQGTAQRTRPTINFASKELVLAD